MVAAAKTSTAVTAASFNWRYAPAYQAAWRTLRASRRGRCDTAGCASTGVVLPSSGLSSGSRIAGLLILVPRSAYRASRAWASRGKGHAEWMKRQVVILGAGFGGLELSSLLSERLADEVEVTLIDQNDAFTLGFSKLDILFEHQTRDDVRLPYRRLAKRGVVFRQETVVSIDPQRRRVATDEATYEADFLVVALGADYDQAATPGFVEGGFEYYSVEGAERLRDELPSFRGGKVLLAVLSIPFKCPPAPYEGILLLHDYLVERGIRDTAQLHVVTPQPAPIPVSAEASKAVERTMAARGIEYTKRRRVYGIDPADAFQRP
jgi:NADPH-dependent 2,4-dienoyl-CoA reductase/sulfur reductase-like enzyme